MITRLLLPLRRQVWSHQNPVVVAQENEYTNKIISRQAKMLLHPTLERVRATSIRTYKELVKTNLSILLDIDSGFDFDAVDASSSLYNLRNIGFGSLNKHSARKCLSRGCYWLLFSSFASTGFAGTETIFGAPLTVEGICTINQLISIITADESKPIFGFLYFAKTHPILLPSFQTL